MPDQYTKYQYNDSGDLIDPPRIPDMERQLIEAGALGDTALIESLTEDYEEKRHSMAERHNQRVDERADEDRRLLAERDERAREESASRVRADADARSREEADRLREEAAANRSTGEPTTVQGGGNS